MASWPQKLILFLLLIGIQSLWSYTNLTPAEVHTRLVDDDSLLVLDVREVSEYKEGHMAEPPGYLPITPVNMPLNSNVLEQHYSDLPRDIDIIVYCRSGSRSATASSFLETQGFTRIYNMTGGFSSWNYEFRIGGYGDHSGHWVHSTDHFPATITYVENADTSKIIFPASALPEGLDSLYMELHRTSTSAHIPPDKPLFDLDNIFRMTALNRFGLPMFVADSLSLSNSIDVYFSFIAHVKSLLNPSMYVYDPGEGWPAVSTQYDSLSFYRAETILRKWYFVGGNYDPTGLQEKSKNLYSAKYILHQNHPNPFNPKTIINYELPIMNFVEMSIYSLHGKKVATLVSEKQNPGYHQIVWDASRFASGIYYYRLITEAGFVQTRKLMLIK